MSTIVNKPFDPQKKIDRISFKGAPAVMAATDMNRFVDSLKFQLGNVEMFLPALMTNVFSLEGLSTTGGDVNHSTSTVEKNLLWTSGSITVGGSEFPLPASQKLLSIESPLAAANRRFICLYAEKTLITAEDDASKEISGVKFLDDSTASAASHYVWGDVAVEIVTSVTPQLLTKSLVAVIGCVEFYGITPPEGSNFTTSLILNKFFTLPADKYNGLSNVIGDAPIGSLPTVTGTTLKPWHSLRQAVSFIKKFIDNFGRYTNTDAFDAIFPKGCITGWYGAEFSDIPDGFIFCGRWYVGRGYDPYIGKPSGETTSLTAVNNLLAAINEKYGTTFVVDKYDAISDFVYTIDFSGQTVGGVTIPNLSNKFLVATGQSNVGAAYYSLGDTGGADEVTLTAAQSGLPAHSHPITQIESDSTGETLNAIKIENTDTLNPAVISTANSVAANAAAAHENRPPFVAIPYIIKVY
jgi:microcystin-dependent protein